MRNLITWWEITFFFNCIVYSFAEDLLTYINIKHINHNIIKSNIKHNIKHNIINYHLKYIKHSLTHFNTYATMNERINIKTIY